MFLTVAVWSVLPHFDTTPHKCEFSLILIRFCCVFPQYGLYSSFMGCFVYFFLGTSKDITVGPTAIMSLLVSMYGERDPNDKELHLPEYAILMTFFCGIIQFALGVLRVGELGKVFF